MKFAVIGCGRMGRNHIENIYTAGLELVGVCDINPDCLSLAERERGVPQSLHFADPTNMLAETKPEGLVIATTANNHCDLTCLAAEMGCKVVLCEKPMATSLADCDRMLATCSKAGARLAINHQMRFMEQYLRPKALLLSPDFGGLSSITVVAGNFGLAMNGTHYFEMFRFLTDEDPFEVSAWLSDDPQPNPRGEQFQDRAGQVRLTTRSGRRMYLEAAADQGHGIRVTYAARLGHLVSDELTGQLQVSRREDPYRDLPTTRYGMPATQNEERIAPADSLKPSLDVLRAVVADDDFPDGHHGRSAVAVLVAAHVSNESNHQSILVKNESLPLNRKFPWA